MVAVSLSSPASAEAKTTSFCIACDSEAVFTCSRCKLEQYCSRACQVAHWQYHKLMCLRPLEYLNMVFNELQKENGADMDPKNIRAVVHHFKRTGGGELHDMILHGGFSEDQAFHIIWIYASLMRILKCSKNSTVLHEFCHEKLAAISDSDYARCGHDRSLPVRMFVAKLRAMQRSFKEDAEVVLGIEEVKSIFIGLRVLRETRVGELSEFSKLAIRVFFSDMAMMKSFHAHIYREEEGKSKWKFDTNGGPLTRLIMEHGDVLTKFKGHTALCHLFVYLAEREYRLRREVILHTMNVDALLVFNLKKLSTAKSTLIEHLNLLHDEVLHGGSTYKNEHELEADAAYKDLLTMSVCYWCLKSNPAYDCPGGCDLKYCNEACAHLHAPYHERSCHIGRLGLWERIRIMLVNGECKKLKKLLRLNSIH